jgi:hypothetical protein
MSDTPDVRQAEVAKKPEFGELTKRTAAVGEFQATTLQWIVRFTLGALKEMRDDAQIALGLALIKGPIYSAINRVRFECDSPKVKAFIEEEFNRLWRGAVRSSLSAVEFGFAAHEKIWSQDADGVHLDQIKDLDPMWSVLLHDEDGDFAGIRWTPMPSFAIGTAFIQPVTVPAEKCFIFTHWKEFGNPYGRHRMTCAANFYRWGHALTLLMGQYAERCAIPPWKGWAPAEVRFDSRGAPIDCVREMQENLLTLKAGGVVTFPDERDDKGNPRWGAEIMGDKLAGMDMLLKAIQYCDTMKLRGMIIPDATATQKDVGARSLSEAHQEIFMILEEQLLFDILDQFEQYLVPQMVLYNFGPTAPKVKLVSDGLSEENKTRLSSLIEKLIAQPVTAELIAEAIDTVKVLQDGDVPVKEDVLEAYESGEPLEPQDIPAPVALAPDMAVTPATAGSTGAAPQKPSKLRRASGRELMRLSGIRDERDAVIARGVIEAGKHFDQLIEGVKKN